MKRHRVVAKFEKENSFSEKVKDLIKMIKHRLEPIRKKGLMRSCIDLWQYIKNQTKIIRYELTHLGETNWNLALYHFDQQNMNDALFRLKLLKFWGYKGKGAEDIYYYIGRCYLERLQFEKAKKYLMAYENLGQKGGSFDKDNKQKETKYCLYLINNDVRAIENLALIPSSIIAHRFNSLAARYNALCIEGRAHSPQAELSNLIMSSVKTSPGKRYRVLDLGCGTGVIGHMCVAGGLGFVGNIVGVDLALEMLKIARTIMVNDKQAYQELVQDNAWSYLASLSSKDDGRYDIIIASDLITYCARVEDLMKMSINILNEEGIIALAFRSLSTSDSGQMKVEQPGREEERDSNRPVHFNTTSEQFIYSCEFVKKIALGLGLQILQEREVSFANLDQGVVMVLVKKGKAEDITVAIEKEKP